MRVRVKRNDDEISCLVVAADNADERKRLNNFYLRVIDELSDLNGKQVHPHKKSKAAHNKIASEQAPQAINKARETYRKSRATRSKNKKAKSQSESS